ncbi:hypothetical protein D3C71_1473040 [compost metagenome]
MIGGAKGDGQHGGFCDVQARRNQPRSRSNNGPEFSVRSLHTEGSDLFANGTGGYVLAHAHDRSSRCISDHPPGYLGHRSAIDQISAFDRDYFHLYEDFVRPADRIRYVGVFEHRRWSRIVVDGSLHLHSILRRNLWRHVGSPRSRERAPCRERHVARLATAGWKAVAVPRRATSCRIHRHFNRCAGATK